MLLSFSVPEMRPMIEAGLQQLAGHVVGDARVKRQTIRALGPRNRQLLDRAKDAGWTIRHDLHLWWKSRTKDRAFLGRVSFLGESGSSIFAYPIEILHSRVDPPGGEPYQCIRVCGPRWSFMKDGVAFWSPDVTRPGSAIEQLARADGFDDVEAFRDFFVPNMGDRFDGVLFKW